MVLVGGRKDSETYVRNKKKACAEVGIVDFGASLPEDATEEDVLQVLVLQSCAISECKVQNSEFRSGDECCDESPLLPQSRKHIQCAWDWHAE